MPKLAFYAVRKGRKTGAIYKKFSNVDDAQQFLSGAISPAQSAPVPQNVKSKASSSGADILVYCDGACKNNGQQEPVAGLGVWWGPNDDRNIAERCPGAQTNNRAELIAIARVLESTPITKSPLVIKTDSQYSIKCFQMWLPKWKENGFRTSNGQPVKNDSLIRYIDVLLGYRGAKGQLVKLEHVPGHKGIVGNEGADTLANRGATFPPVPERDWQKLRTELESQLINELATNPQSQPIPTQISISKQEWEAYAEGYADPSDLEKDLED